MKNIKGTWTEPALKLLKERYLLKREDWTQETPEEMCWRVAKAVAMAEPVAEQEHWTTVFATAMIKHDWVPNTPCLTNAGAGPGGTTLKSTAACYVCGLEDSLEALDSASLHCERLMLKPPAAASPQGLSLS
jgi:ribonucleoside-diphosphate reductase alpha chain